MMITALITPLAASPIAADEQSDHVYKALTATGFRGNMAGDCTKPSSLTNPHLNVDIEVPDLIILNTSYNTISVTEQIKDIDFDEKRITLTLASLTTNADWWWNRVEIYERHGTRFRMLEDIITSASPVAQKNGFKIRVDVQGGMIIDRNQLTPYLERCAG